MPKINEPETLEYSYDRPGGDGKWERIGWIRSISKQMCRLCLDYIPAGEVFLLDGTCLGSYCERCVIRRQPSNQFHVQVVSHERATAKPSAEAITWREWRDVTSSPGQCPCGIDKQQCGYHSG